MVKVKNMHLNISSKKILNNISFELKKNSLMLLLGENGSGKSMLLKTITGYYKNYDGDILIKENNLKTIKDIDRAKIITYVSGDFNTEFEYSVYNIVEMGRYVFGNKPLTDIDFEYVKKCMRNLDVWKLKDKNIQSVSTGERMRIFLARALATEAEILLLDEPAASLDIKHKSILYSLIKNITKDNKSIIMSMHDINDAIYLKTDMIMLNSGILTACGVSDEILDYNLIKTSYGVECKISKCFVFY